MVAMRLVALVLAGLRWEASEGLAFWELFTLLLLGEALLDGMGL